MRRIGTGLLLVVAVIVATLWWQRRTALGAEGFAAGAGAITVGVLGASLAAIFIGWLIYSIVAGRARGPPLLGKVN